MPSARRSKTVIARSAGFGRKCSPASAWYARTPDERSLTTVDYRPLTQIKGLIPGRRELLSNVQATNLGAPNETRLGGRSCRDDSEWRERHGRRVHGSGYAR